VTDSEIVSLHNWLETFGRTLPDWPGGVLARNVARTLEDGYVSDEERSDLKSFLDRMVGDGLGQRYDEPTSLPLDQPPPVIDYNRTAFCLTGTFIYGPRKQVAACIGRCGGRVVDAPGNAEYLVIGATITPSWKFGNFGLKIENAVERRARGLGPAILSERHWVTSLPVGVA
jgi:hypothetical protein